MTRPCPLCDNPDASIAAQRHLQDWNALTDAEQMVLLARVGERPAAGAVCRSPSTTTWT
jgi:hypothetical protein